MTSLDPTLTKMRLFEESSFDLLTEKAQDWTDFVKEIQAYYQKKGKIYVPDKMVNELIRILGIEKVKSVGGVSIAKAMQKYGIGFTTVDNALNSKLNPSQDENISNKIDQLLKVMMQVETNTSATRSAQELQSADVYAMLKLIERRLPNQRRLVAKRRAEQPKHENGSIYDNQDLTSKTVLLTSGDYGTVIIDSDDQQGLSQASLDVIANKLQSIVPGVKFSETDIKAKPHHIWVLTVASALIDVKKTQIESPEYKPIFDAYKELTAKEKEDEIKAQQQAKYDDAFIKSQSHSLAKDTSNMNKISSDIGFDMGKIYAAGGRDGSNLIGNQIKLSVGQTMGNSSAKLIFDWIASAKGNNNIRSTRDMVTLKGEMQGTRLSNSDFSVQFSGDQPALKNVQSIFINNVTQDEFRKGTQTNRLSRISVGVSGKGIIITNINS